MGLQKDSAAQYEPLYLWGDKKLISFDYF